MTVYESIDEEIWNVLEHARHIEEDMECVLNRPDELEKLDEYEKRTFEHNLPIFRRVNELLKSLKGWARCP